MLACCRAWGLPEVAADKEGEATDLQWVDSSVSGGIGTGVVIRPQRICVIRAASRARLEGICIGEGFKATNRLAVVGHLGLIEAIGDSADKSPFWGPSKVYSRSFAQSKVMSSLRRLGPSAMWNVNAIVSYSRLWRYRPK